MHATVKNKVSVFQKRIRETKFCLTEVDFHAQKHVPDGELLS